MTGNYISQPQQIPITTFDQHLLVLAKLIRWKWAEVYGESIHVMMASLHTEMALWKTMGDVVEASGWTDALTEAEVASSGIADSFLKVAHVHLNRIRHAHKSPSSLSRNFRKRLSYIQRAMNQK